jgi:hypothetical protein
MAFNSKNCGKLITRTGPDKPLIAAARGGMPEKIRMKAEG